MLWIFDNLIENGLITHEEAIAKMRSLISGNIVYQNNMELNVDIEKRIKRWSSEFQRKI